MKKYIALALGLLFILGFTATAFAIHIPDLPPDEQIVTAKGSEISLGGRIMVRGWYFSNAFFEGALGTSTNVTAVPGEPSHGVEPNDVALWTTNIALTLAAKISENVQGFIELEVAQGENVQSGLYIWGGGPNVFQGHDSKPNADLRFRQAWILYTGSGLLGAPAGIKIGHQLITLGEKQFLNHERFGDDALIVFVNPTKELHIAAATVKANEGAYTLPGDDLNVYALIGTYKLNKDNTAGINYALFQNTDLEDTFGGVYTGLDELSFQNLGLHANGMLAGMINYAVEFDTQFGKAKGVDTNEPEHNDVGDVVLEDLKYRGYALYIKGGYQIPDTPLNLRASFAYGSGDGNGIGDGKISEFQVSQGFDSEVAVARFVHYTQIYEKTIATAALIQTLGGNGAILGTAQGAPHRNTGIANTTYYNLGLDLAATKDLSLSLDGFLLRATKTGGWQEVTPGNPDVSKNLGWELDFKGSYKLAKNLTYFIEAGSFAAGAFYEDTGLVDNKASVKQIIHGLNLTF
ncbi:MAG: hypothetical protein ABIB41_07940 [Nitrospirota bacterium]